MPGTAPSYIVGNVKRRLLTILLPLAAATLGAGCTTFTDNDAALRVNDVEYSHDDLDGVLQAVGVSGDASYDLGGIRSIAETLVLAELIDDVFQSNDIEVTDADIAASRTNLETDLPAFADASDRVQDLLAQAQARFDISSTRPDVNDLLAASIDDADVYVDPQIGVYDTESGTILPLG